MKIYLSTWPVEKDREAMKALLITREEHILLSYHYLCKMPLRTLLPEIEDSIDENLQRGGK